MVVCAALMGCDSVLDLGDSNDAGGSGGGTGSLRFDVPVVLATKGNAQCGDLTGLGPQSAGKAFYPLLATRLTPDFYPVQVNQVRYVLQAPPGETVLKAHRAWLYVSRFPAGPADSTPITRWDVPETTVAAGDVATFSLDIRTVAPPLLHDGESILVVVDTSPLGPQGPVNRLSLCHRSEALTETRFFFAGDGWAAGSQRASAPSTGSPTSSPTACGPPTPHRATPAPPPTPSTRGAGCSRTSPTPPVP
ncbi:MAG: hypothetical protein IPJ65_20905 [Archangiaceae bacterium]|nr:hypothetical protein [Archangiaceae bacterium]